MTSEPVAAANAASQPVHSRTDRLIPLAVNLLGIVLVAGLAYYFGSALFEGVTARAVAVVGIVGVVAVVALAPDVGLLLWIVVAPFGRLFNISMGRGLPDMSLNRIVALCVLFLLFAQVATGKRKLARLTAVEGWGLVFLLAMVLSIGASRLGLIGGVQNAFDYAALPLLCFYFGRNLLNKPKRMPWLAVMLAILVAMLGVIAAREQLTNQAVLSPLPFRWHYGQHSVKVTSLFGAPAIMAMTTALPLPYLLTGAMRSKELATRLLWFLALAAAAAGLLLTYVRAGWLTAVVGLAIVALLARRKRAALMVVLLLALLAALVLGAGLIDVRSLQERLQADQPIEYRMNAISVGLEIAKKAPLLGLGLDNYSDAAIAAGWQPTGRFGLLAVAPHNLFVYVLTSAGFLALLPFLAMLGAMGLRLLHGLRSTERNLAKSGQRDWVVAGLAMLIGYVVIGNTFDALGAQLANMVFFLSLGATFAALEAPDAGTGDRELAVPEAPV